MKNPYLILFCLVFPVCIAQAQSDSTHLRTIATQLEKQTASHPIEKVYLHLNKPTYSPGDTIWYKGYVTVGTHHQPSALSGVLYVEVLDNTDKILKRQKLKVTGGIASGNIATAEALKAGDYHIRAYTNWMRNAGPEYFFNQNVTVADAGTSAVWVTPVVDQSGRNHEGPVNAKLSFTDKQGRYYGHKPVSYEVKADSVTISKGTGITDERGSLSFAFSDKSAGQKTISIVSHIKLLPDFTIDKTTVINNLKTASASQNGPEADVQFFPEGGQLINGVRSKIAFKATGTNGIGIDIHGSITDNEHNEVANFATRHAGMGILAMTPEAGKTYTAKITLPDSSIQTITLPAATEKGFVLAINNNDSTKITVRIATNQTTIKANPNNTIYLVGQSAGAIYYTTAIKLDEVSSSFAAAILKSRFPAGITQFTLFSANMEPLNERVVFINNRHDELNLNLSTDKQNYSPGEKVSLALMAKDNETNKPIAGNFSVSVYQEKDSTSTQNTDASILSSLLLTSDLKGYIENPNYYFNKENEEAQAMLDNLMLTQGYRRFSWKEVMANSSPVNQYQPEKVLPVAGRLTTLSGKPVAKGKLKLIDTKDNLVLDTLSDEQGRFSFPDPGFADSTQLVIQGRTAKDDKYVNIAMDNSKNSAAAIDKGSKQSNPMSLPLTAFNGKLPAIPVTDNEIQNTVNAAHKAGSFNFSQNNTLGEITVKTRQNAGTDLPPWQAVVTRSANLNGPGHADQVLGGEDIRNCAYIKDCLLGKIPGLMALYNKQTGDIVNFYFSRHVAQSITKLPTVIFIIDGLIADMNMLDNLVGDRVKTIEVLKSTSYLAMYGQNASGGALIITTKQGNEGEEEYASKSTPGITYMGFRGFEKTREFYVPKYAANSVAAKTDNRNAIYWNPNVITDEKGALKLEFPNTAVTGIFRAVVQGIDNDGRVGSYAYTYKVQ